MFLCIFTNFFLILLRKKTFLRLLLCIFTNRQKMQSADQTLRAVCRQQHSESLRTSYTDEHFSRQKVGIFIPAPAGKHFVPQFIFSYRANLSLPAFSNIHFYKSLPSSNLFPVLPQPPTKKLSLRLSFSRCI